MATSIQTLIADIENGKVEYPKMEELANKLSTTEDFTNATKLQRLINYYRLMNHADKLRFEIMVLRDCDSKDIDWPKIMVLRNEMLSAEEKACKYLE